MPCRVDPTPEEIEAGKAQHKLLLQTAIAFDEFKEYWREFQAELCEFLKEYNGSLKDTAALVSVQTRFPKLALWMKDHAEADHIQREHDQLVRDVKEKIDRLDDDSLRQLGLQRI